MVPSHKASITSLAFLAIGFVSGAGGIYLSQIAGEASRAQAATSRPAQGDEQGSPDLLAGLARVYAQHAQSERAAALYRQAIQGEKSAQKKAEYLTGLAEVCLAGKNLDQAKGLYSQALLLAEERQKGALRVRMAHAFAKAGAQAEAESALKEAIARTEDPGFRRQAQQQLLSLCKTSGKLDEATADARKRMQD